MSRGICRQEPKGSWPALGFWSACRTRSAACWTRTCRGSGPPQTPSCERPRTSSSCWDPRTVTWTHQHAGSEHSFTGLLTQLKALRRDPELLHVLIPSVWVSYHLQNTPGGVEGEFLTSWWSTTRINGQKINEVNPEVKYQQHVS